jgi:hypothetical protein
VEDVHAWIVPPGTGRCWDGFSNPRRAPPKAALPSGLHRQAASNNHP